MIIIISYSQHAVLLSSTILSSQLDKAGCKLSEEFDCLTIGLKFAFQIFRASLQKETQTKHYYHLENVYTVNNNYENLLYIQIKALMIHGLLISKRSFVNNEMYSGIATFNNNAFMYENVRARVVTYF